MPLEFKIAAVSFLAFVVVFTFEEKTRGGVESIDLVYGSLYLIVMACFAWWILTF